MSRVATWKFGGTNESVTYDDQSGFESNWVNPANAGADDGTYVTLSVEDGHSSWLVARNFSWDIDAEALIDGIEVRVEKHQDLDSTGGVSDLSVMINIDGSGYGDEKKIAGQWPGTDQTFDYGGTSDDWGIVLTGDDVNDSGFGVGLAAIVGDGEATGSALVDYIQMQLNYHIQYDVATIGGGTVGGSSEISLIFDEVSDGGVSAGGHASLEFFEVADGGATMGGSSKPLTILPLITGDGGATVNGSYDYSFTAVPPVSGGSVGGGSATFNVVQSLIIADGGAAVGGESENTRGYQTIISGGATVAGAATSFFIDYFVPSGGVVGSGEAPGVFVDSVEIESAGVTSGGSASVYKTYVNDGTGGITIGGAADPVHNFYQPIGGSTAGGEAFVIHGYIGQGGIDVGGGAKRTHIDYVEEIGNEGVEAGGIAGVSSKKVFFWMGTGGAGTAGVSVAGIKNAFYNASGGVQIDNSLDPTIVNNRFTLDTDILWRVRAYVTNDITFIWNTGKLGVYFYRVIGQGRQGDECNLKADPCCQKYIMNIQARSIPELCEKISERKFILPIESVQRFARPAALSNIFDDYETQQRLIEDYEEENGDCNELEPVEICNIPECADFCVDFDLKVDFKFDITKLQFEAFPEFEAGWGVPTDRTVVVSGTAITSFTKNLPDFKFVASGLGQDSTAEDPRPGIYITDGKSGSRTEPNSWSGRGGAVVGGASARIGFSGWNYAAGEYPTFTDGFGNVVDTTYNLEGENNDETSENWVLTERVTADDDQYTHVDVSFSKESEWLIVRNFKLNIPDNAVVKGFTVLVNRYSTQVGTRDKSIRIVHGYRIVEDTLDISNPVVDWPLIETEGYYGNSGLPFDTNPNWKGNQELFPWDIEEMKSPEFGVALKVEDTSGLTAAVPHVDSIKVVAQWEIPNHQYLRIGGSSKVVSSSYSYQGSGGITIAEETTNYTVQYRFKSMGLGTGQPTAFLMGGTYGVSLDYTADDTHFEWTDDAEFDEVNTGSVAYWPEDAASDELDGSAGSEIWATPERALIADASTTTSPSYAEVELSGAASSEYLVVRNWPLSLDQHFRIHGIRVLVANRFAQNISSPGTTYVEDTHVYLVNGTTIRSDNLAKIGEQWPEFPDTAVYGSTGFDGSTQFRDLEADPLLPDEINDPGFGIAIAVENSDSTAGTFAKIDGIAMEFTIEAFGRLLIQVVEPQIGGSAEATSHFENYTSNPEISVGGTAEVKPFWEVGDGGVEVNVEIDPLEALLKKPTERVIYTIDTSGGASLGGIAFVPEGVFGYTGSGSVSVSGVAGRKVDNWTFESDGNAIFVLGSASHSPADFGTLKTSIGFSMEILQTNANFGEDVDNQDAESLTGVIEQCGCLQIPLIVELAHNFVRDNVFAKFLVRNNFTVPSKMSMRYNSTNDSWQSNLHYRGLSADANTEEKWDVVFELQCTNSMGGINIGRRIWKLSMSVLRKILTTQEDFDTRVIVGILPEAICEVNANEIDFRVDYNTALNFASVNPEATVYQNSIFDNIGLFRNRSWTENPDLVFLVSQSGLQSGQSRLNLTNPVLYPADSGRLNINNL